MRGPTLGPHRLDRRVPAILTTVLLAVLSAGCFTPSPPNVQMTVKSAAWVFDSPTLGLHSARGEYYLSLNVSLQNSGDSDAPLSPTDFTVYWQGVAKGQAPTLSPWTSFTVKWGSAASVTLGLNSSTLYLPDRLELKFLDRPVVTAAIPAPLAPPSEVNLTVIDVAWADAGLQGLPPARGDTYLWVHASMRNQWKDQVKLSNANFWVARPSGEAIAAVGFLGPASVPPLRSVEVRLAFEVPTDWSGTELGYDMGLGPWTSAPLPAINDRVAFYSGGMAIGEVAWSYESPVGAHALPGNYYLFMNVTLSNTGLGVFTAPQYTLAWADGSFTALSDPRVPAPGESLVVQLAFPVAGLVTPQVLTARVASGTLLAASVPAPAAPPVEVELAAVTSVWADANLNGVAPRSGMTFIWVNATVKNAWTNHLALSLSNFWLVLPDGRAVAASAYTGPASIPPLLKGDIRLAFEVPYGWSDAQLSFEMGEGPWTTVTLPAPREVVAYYGGVLTVARAGWSCELPGGAHTAAGDYALNLEVLLSNTAYGTFSGVEFSLQWSDNTRSNVTDPHVVAPGGTLLLPMAFQSTGLRSPRSMSPLLAPGRLVMASVPSPAPPPTEVDFQNLSSAQADASLDGVPPGAGKMFLWVNASVSNNWNKDITTAIPSFTLEGQNGFKVAAANRSGPDAVGPGGLADVALAFEVPSGFSPTRLHFAMPAGPWTNVSVPAPTKSVVFRSADLAFTAAAWDFESPSGAYAARGSLYLYLNASVSNLGHSNVSVTPASFEAIWNGTGVAQTGVANWVPVLLRPGASASVQVAFLAGSPLPPDSVRFAVDPSTATYAWKEVPVPSAPQAKIHFANINATWSNTSLGGLNASAGNRFLWLTFDLVNLWDSSISLGAAFFACEGSGNTTYGAPQFRGPSTVGAGGRANITLVFEVPSNWNPRVLHFDMAGGPWADTSLPLPP